ncbi:hypothetical protein ISN45_At05g050000 [Arabidopsis thaliana x Arabidopsis arenosa]|uniref:Uncharacterized protein n=2 Tax=Arabidopsis TaxID=3701 RepID=A0A178UN14_ARATH|nr:hypothetical protein ISN45_At05g050000 [Arabidopsis thaliana x Arabidopsis arenosa]OAO95456.1 hypothetical protein AXX17_AT5G53390 [Arabidopsis thaliana]
MAATLHKQVKKEILDNNPDKAIFIFDEWKVGKIPLFEDGKTTAEIIAMSKGEFEVYVCEKYDDPSQMKKTEKIGNKKRMKVMKPKQKKNVGSSNTTQDEETDKDLKKNVASLPDEKMEKLVEEDSATPDEETEKDLKKSVGSLDTTPDEETEKVVKEESATPDEETEKDVNEAA